MSNLLERILLTFVLSAFTMAYSFSQSRTITGKVVNAANGNGIESASVNEDGTTNGTTTAPDGSFLLSVASGNVTLSVSSVGFATQSVGVSAETNNITVEMVSTSEELSEVVVTALGISSEKLPVLLILHR